MVQGPTSMGSWKYVAVAASQGNAQLTLRAGTILRKILVVPATIAPGAITLHDGTGVGETNLTVFTGTAAYDAGLAPFTIDFGEQGIRARNVVGTLDAEGWHIDTGANVSIVACVQEQ